MEMVWSLQWSWLSWPWWRTCPWGNSLPARSPPPPSSRSQHSLLGLSGGGAVASIQNLGDMLSVVFWIVCQHFGSKRKTFKTASLHHHNQDPWHHQRQPYDHSQLVSSPLQQDEGTLIWAIPSILGFTTVLWPQLCQAASTYFDLWFRWDGLTTDKFKDKGNEVPVEFSAHNSEAFAVLNPKKQQGCCLQSEDDLRIIIMMMMTAVIMMTTWQCYDCRQNLYLIGDKWLIYLLETILWLATNVIGDK